jgi:hypothetical protein
VGVSDGPDGANAENAINDSARTRNGTGKKTDYRRLYYGREMIDNTKKVLPGRGVFLRVCWGVELRERRLKAVEVVEVVVVGWWCGAKEPNSKKVGIQGCENPRLEKKKEKKIRALFGDLGSQSEKRASCSFHTLKARNVILFHVFVNKLFTVSPSFPQIMQLPSSPIFKSVNAVCPRPQTYT